MTDNITDNVTEEGSGNYCVVCGVDIGYCNPRQYCCKTYCPKQFETSTQDCGDDEHKETPEPQKMK